MIKRLIIAGWLTTIIFLFFYSFCQIDLGLTLTRASWWQGIQRGFQQIGYFNRPLSTALYLGILFLLFTFYFLLFTGIRRKWFALRKIWFLILATAGILWFSYNAFSYDLFNYIFDARIVTYYHQSPYTYKALDFPDDPMLGFMHWTHRYYPYGPLWLGLTVPLSFLAFQKLILAMVLFKGLAVTGYLFCCFFIYKLLENLKHHQRLLGLSLFAFSPLVIIESLVSAHNDILMMAFSLAAFWFLFKKRYFLSYFMLFLSIGVKFVTFFFLPVFLLVTFCQLQKKKVLWERIWLVCFFLMVAAVFLATRRTEFQPWYLLYVFPFVSLLAKKTLIFWSTTGLSLGALLIYAPFLYLGNWDPPVPTIKFWLIISFLLLGFLLGVIVNLLKDRRVMIK